MKLIKKVITILMIFLIIFSLLPFNSLAANKEEAVTNQINGFMSAIKQYNRKKIDKYLIDRKYPYIKYKKLNKLVKTVNNDHLAYEIKSVKVKGKKATVKVRIYFYSLYEDCRNAMKSTIYDYKKSWSANKILKNFASGLIDEYVTTNYDDGSIQSNTFTLNLTLKLKKQGGKWKIESIPKKKAYFLDAALFDFLYEFSKDPYDTMGWK